MSATTQTTSYVSNNNIINNTRSRSSLTASTSYRNNNHCYNNIRSSRRRTRNGRERIILITNNGLNKKPKSLLNYINKSNDNIDNSNSNNSNNNLDMSPLSELQRLSEEQPIEWTESYNKTDDSLTSDEEEEGEGEERTSSMSNNNNNNNNNNIKLLSADWLENEKSREATALANEALVMFAASFVLGPLLDHQHSRFNVLHYANPITIDMNVLLAPILHNPVFEQISAAFSEPIGFIFVGESGTIETDWWVGPMFGVAGIIMGLGTTTGDSIFLRNGVKAKRIKEIEENLKPVRTNSLILASPAKPAGGWEPSWRFTLASISLFALDYAASGMLSSPDFDFFGGEGHLPYHSIDVFLFLWATVSWAYFDKTYQGLAIAGAAAVGGPLIEIVLINVFHLYAYTNPDFLGIPSWIPWVYACGGPAVGNLSRTVRAKLRSLLKLCGPVCRVPIYESRPSWRPPPRGFDPRTFKATNMKRNFGDDQKKGRFFLLPDGEADLTGIESLDDLKVRKILVSAGKGYDNNNEDVEEKEEENKMPRFQRVVNLYQSIRTRFVRKDEEVGGDDKNVFNSKEEDQNKEDDDDEKKQEKTTPAITTTNNNSNNNKPLLLLAETSSNQKFEQKVSPSVAKNSVDDDKSNNEAVAILPLMTKEERVRDIKRRMAEVELQIVELERLKTLKTKLGEMQTISHEASPLIGPKIKKVRAKINEAVPEVFQPTVKKLNDKIDKIVSHPKIQQQIPSSVLRQFKDDDPGKRVQKIKELKETLKNAQNEGVFKPISKLNDD
jgi:hypothetical protein